MGNYNYYKIHEEQFSKHLFEKVLEQKEQNKKVIFLVHHLCNLKNHLQLLKYEIPKYKGKVIYYDNGIDYPTRDELRKEFEDGHNSKSREFEDTFNKNLIFLATPNMYAKNKRFKEFVDEKLLNDEILLGL